MLGSLKLAIGTWVKLRRNNGTQKTYSGIVTAINPYRCNSNYNGETLVIKLDDDKDRSNLEASFYFENGKPSEDNLFKLVKSLPSKEA